MQIKVCDDGFAGHVRRSLQRVKKMESGKRLRSEKVITFADPIDMVECLTPQRIRICQILRKQPRSIAELAGDLGRGRNSVAKDVKALKEFGLLRFRGLGDSETDQLVEPAAEKILLRSSC